MKARVKLTGEIIEVERLTNTTYGRLDVAQIYRKDMLDFDLPEPEEEVTIEGWVARDSDGTLGIFAVKPKRVRYKHNNKNGLWMARTITDLVPEVFPSVTWESEPLAVTITINPKKK